MLQLKLSIFQNQKAETLNFALQIQFQTQDSCISFQIGNNHKKLFGFIFQEVYNLLQAIIYSFYRESKIAKITHPILLQFRFYEILNLAQYSIFVYLQQFLQQKTMGFRNRLKQFVKVADLFSCSEMLRYNQQHQYKTMTGGIISLGIIITTIIGFASMIIDTLNLTTITTVTEVTKDINPGLSVLTSSAESHFMFAVQVWLVNSTGTERYFDVTLSNIRMKGDEIINTTFIPLQPCTKQHWNWIPSVSGSYDQLGIGNWLCPPIGQNFQIYGKYSSDQYSSYGLSVSACKDETDPSRPCASQEAIDELFTSFNSFFYYTLYYSNPTINPSKKDYLSYYLQDQDYVIFGDLLGSQAYVYFTDYTVQTDYSIWPFTNKQTDKGFFVQNLAVNHPYQTVPNGTYASIYFAKSANSITFTRQVQKITSVFSFIGGMISAASAFLFFIKIYTNLSFEVSIALSIFQPEQKQGERESSKSLSMNFINFVKYYYFEFCKILGMPPNWTQSSFLSQCQQQIVMQLDIKTLVKRIIFIEHCLTYIFEDYELDCLQLKTPTTPNQIRAIRQKCESAIEGQQPQSQHSAEKSNKKLGYGQAGKQIDLNNQINFNDCLQSPLQSVGNLRQEQKNTNQRLQHNDIIIEDVANQELKGQLQYEKYNKSIYRLKSKNIVFNQYQKQRRRDNNLRLLSIKAENGNDISKRLLVSLQKDIKQHTHKRSIKMQSGCAFEDSNIGKIIT